MAITFFLVPTTVLTLALADLSKESTPGTIRFNRTGTACILGFDPYVLATRNPELRPLVGLRRFTEEEVRANISTRVAWSSSVRPDAASWALVRRRDRLGGLTLSPTMTRRERRWLRRHPVPGVRMLLAAGYTRTDIRAALVGLGFTAAEIQRIRAALGSAP